MSGTSSSGGVPDVCEGLPDEAEVSVFGSISAGLAQRDFTMTGNGTFITQDGERLVEIDEMGEATPWLELPVELDAFISLQAAGDGTLLGTSGSYTELLMVSAAGIEFAEVDFGPWFPTVVHALTGGGAWITDWPGHRILRYTPKQGIGVVLERPKGSEPFEIYDDVERERLYWTEGGDLWSASLQAGTLGAPQRLHQTGQAWLPGLARDACGNYYLLAKTTPTKGNQNRLLRLELDESGEAVEREVELVGYGPLGNGGSRLRFGFGFGSALDQSVFTEGDAGEIVVVDVGIEGAAPLR